MPNCCIARVSRGQCQGGAGHVLLLPFGVSFFFFYVILPPYFLLIKVYRIGPTYTGKKTTTTTKTIGFGKYCVLIVKNVSFVRQKMSDISKNAASVPPHLAYF